MKRIIIIFSILSIYNAQDKIDFNPNKLNAPELNWPVVVNVINSGGSKNDKENITDSTFFSVEGFRIQLLATQDRFNAEKFKSELEKIYKNKIYIIFEAPNYKVRVGDFIDRKSAEEMRQNLSKEGYTTAWIIRSKIEAIDN